MYTYELSFFIDHFPVSIKFPSNCQAQLKLFKQLFSRYGKIDSIRFRSIVSLFIFLVVRIPSFTLLEVKKVRILAWSYYCSRYCKLFNPFLVSLTNY